MISGDTSDREEYFDLIYAIVKVLIVVVKSAIV